MKLKLRRREINLSLSEHGLEIRLLFQLEAKPGEEGPEHGVGGNHGQDRHCLYKIDVPQRPCVLAEVGLAGRNAVTVALHRGVWARMRDCGCLDSEEDLDEECFECLREGIH